VSVAPLLTVVLLAAPPSGAAEVENDAVVRSVRDRTRALAGKEKSLQKHAQDVWECSTEGGEQVALREAGKVRKIVRRIFGEMGRVRDEYYFDDSGLYFAFLVTEWYERPLSVVELHPKVAKKSEDRLYFDKGVLHAWVRGKELKAGPTEEWPNKAKQVQHSAKAALAAAESDAKAIHCTADGGFRPE
jgi:hypothetical protein